MGTSDDEHSFEENGDFLDWVIEFPDSDSLEFLSMSISSCSGEISFQSLDIEEWSLSSFLSSHSSDSLSERDEQDGGSFK